ncbi:uncharacterized protein CEXT_458681 [Caerostris extrusa]|uniref:Uncharacterized protein n=1 Tax=Caerostris extrusa TaxID=172846 RepID=A0AAV4MW59_CAEEX|nr:uncharacterized protein CEXT_458681 [Caerostris extrusa]
MKKITRQYNTIQSVKSQLSSTISHLKHLKDAATKQLKKQKHQTMKSLKLKQQLHDAKEFHLNEMLARLSSINDSEAEKSNLSVELVPDLKKMDCGSQTEKTTSAELLNQKMFSLKIHNYRGSVNESIKSNPEMKTSIHLKEGNIWKLLTVSEQSYLSLLNKLAETLQISDLKGSFALMHSSWLSCDDLADARRQDHKKILQSLERMKKSIRYLQETVNLEPKRQNAENICSDDKKSNTMCHTEEMHYQYLCEVLQKAQENLIKEYSQKRPSHRTIVTAGSGRANRHVMSRERRIPLELKNGKILALLDDKMNHKELLPSKLDFNKMEGKTVSEFYDFFK